LFFADSRRREHTASDSETESSKRQRPYTTRSAPNIKAFFVSSPEPESETLGERKRHSSPAKMTSPTKDNRTVHEAPRGPGWIEGPSGDRDGLDDLISGIQSGEVEAEDEDPVEIEGNPNPWANKFKCGQAHDGTAAKGPNEWLASKFDEMYNMYTGAKHKSHFQLRGYMLGECCFGTS
jgi:DNA polymerase lambda